MRLLKIGREAGNDIVLHSDKVSSLHAEITLLDSGDIQLEDKNSRNGTYIMNQRIAPGKPVNIRRGDAIRFADVELQWSQIPMPEDNSAYKAIYGIGSNFQNDLQISGATVSRYHATIKIGRDDKVYIVDHSKNGTTVNSVKITPNQPYRIKRSSKVVCGGVPVDTSRIPWPSNPWKWVAGIAAALVIVAGVGFGVWKLMNSTSTWDQKRISARFNSTTVMLEGIYHYEVECGDLPLEILNAIGIPTKFYFTSSGLKSYGQEATLSTISAKDDIPTYTASGFFFSFYGKILTNLHVVKPWLFDGMLEKVESFCRNKLAEYAEIKTGTVLLTGRISGLHGYISQLKVKGVCDGILLVPQGSFYSMENAIMCHPLSAGDDPNVDVALIQSDKSELPNSHCTYVNVQDSMAITDDALAVGTAMFTIGFPHGKTIQELDSHLGLQALCHSGHITMVNSEYKFTFDATSYHGASGSPIFDEHGYLIGILNSGVEKENINQGIKAKYIRELLDKPYKY